MLAEALIVLGVFVLAHESYVRVKDTIYGIQWNFLGGRKAFYKRMEKEGKKNR